MQATRKELRARARASLKGNWGKAIGAIFLSAIPSFVLGFLGAFSQSLKIAGDIMSFLIAGMMALGAAMFYLALARQQNPKATDVYQGFNTPGKAFLLYLLVLVFTILWMLLLTIPGTIAAYSYSMDYWMLLPLIIPGIIAVYRYSMAYYILADNPDITPLEAIRRSKQMMAGHKWRLFLLQLSFIGWFLLCILTLGIASLWVSSYIAVATAHFYEDLKNQGEKPPVPNAI
ncbi:DUF975 family protein [Cohnella soli]|uniref:DUF975 family protein n=1 Tax=Cohnella soli TaxID=425005 RepID=A0ABW0HMB0_9BACL